MYAAMPTQVTFQIGSGTKNEMRSIAQRSAVGLNATGTAAKEKVMGTIEGAGVGTNRGKREDGGFRDYDNGMYDDKAVRTEFKDFYVAEDEPAPMETDGNQYPPVEVPSGPRTISWKEFLSPEIFAMIPSDSDAARFFTIPANKTLHEEDLVFLMQLPAQLPQDNPKRPPWMPLRTAIDDESRETVKNEGSKVYMDHLAEEMFQTSYFENISNLSGLGAELIITKSGKMKLKMGATVFDCFEGKIGPSAHQLVQIDTTENIAAVLDHNVCKKLVVALPLSNPDFSNNR